MNSQSKPSRAWIWGSLIGSCMVVVQVSMAILMLGDWCLMVAGSNSYGHSNTPEIQSFLGHLGLLYRKRWAPTHCYTWNNNRLGCDIQDFLAILNGTDMLLRTIIAKVRSSLHGKQLLRWSLFIMFWDRLKRGHTFRGHYKAVANSGTGTNPEGERYPLCMVLVTWSRLLDKNDSVSWVLLLRWRLFVVPRIAVRSILHSM